MIKRISLCLCCLFIALGAAHDARAADAPLREAIGDLIATFGDRYPHGAAYLERLDAIEQRGDKAALEALRREALLANPLVQDRPILFVVRKQYRSDHHSTATLFQTGEINAGKFDGGSALKVLDAATGRTRTLLDSPGGVVRDPEISADGERVLFAMRRDRHDDYHIYEVRLDGSGLRQLTFGRAVSDIDPAYLPDGSIVFSSTRDYKFCQCNRHIMANLFRMDRDGANIHRIGGNTLFEGHAHVMPDGLILYDRWEYVDRQFGPSFGLWTCRPDGTNHALFYGNNAWSPGMIADARMVGESGRFVATYGSCHDRPWGAIAIVDRVKGLDGLEPIVHAWPRDLRPYLSDADVNDPSHGRAGRIDAFKSLPIKYEDPFPLVDADGRHAGRYFLCSRMTGRGEEMALYVLDTFGNEVLLHAEAPGCYDPMPIAPLRRPAVMPEFTEADRADGLCYVVDVYRGTGMQRVERGAIKYLRVVEAPPKRAFTGDGWNIDATQAPAMNWNVTNNKRILGDVPVEADGSAYFRLPADRFVYFQALDENKMMVQSMRSGTLVRPGETIGCVGCHENRNTTVPSHVRPLAMTRPPRELEPWYGPPRDFNYLTEVQPVFDRHCVSCHDYGKEGGEALNLAGDLGLVFNTSYIELRRKGGLRWEPHGRKTLIKAVDDGPPQVLPPYAWGSHGSTLIDVLRGGHYDVKLSREEFERIVTWIDLNGVYYGSYASAYPQHRWGRSPLSPAQLKRLAVLTGVDLGRDGERRGSQVNFTRPQLSPCLAKFTDKTDPHYLEALSIIRAGQAMLAQRPRADMPGFVPGDVDQKRQAWAEQLTQLNDRSNAARQQGEKHYPLRPEGASP